MIKAEKIYILNNRDPFNTDVKKVRTIQILDGYVQYEYLKTGTRSSMRVSQFETIYTLEGNDD